MEIRDSTRAGFSAFATLCIGVLLSGHLQAEDPAWWKVVLSGIGVVAGIILTITNLLCARATSRAKQEEQPPQME